MYPLLRRIFAQFDENGDGYVDSHELVRGLVSTANECPQADELNLIIGDNSWSAYYTGDGREYSDYPEPGTCPD